MGDFRAFFFPPFLGMLQVTAIFMLSNSTKVAPSLYVTEELGNRCVGVILEALHFSLKFTRLTRRRPSVQKSDCEPAHKKLLVHRRNNKACYCSGLAASTSWAPFGGNRGACFLQREITWGLAQWKRTCCSSWTP